MQGYNNWILPTSQSDLTVPEDSQGYFKAKYLALRKRYQSREEEFEEMMNNSLQQIQGLESTLEDCLNELRHAKQVKRELEEELRGKDRELDQLKVYAMSRDERAIYLEKSLKENKMKFEELICIERQKNEIDVHSLRKVIQTQQNELTAAKNYCADLEYKVRSLNGRMKSITEINKSSFMAAEYHSNRKVNILVSAMKKDSKENMQPIEPLTAVNSRVPTHEAIASKPELDESAYHLEPINLDEELFQYANRPSFNELCETPSPSMSPKLLHSRMINKSCLEVFNINLSPEVDITLKQVDCSMYPESRKPVFTISKQKNHRTCEDNLRNKTCPGKDCFCEQKFLVPVPSQRDASALSGFLWFTVKTISSNVSRYLNCEETQQNSQSK